MVFSNRIAERKKLFQVKLQSSFSNKQVFFFSYGGGGGKVIVFCMVIGDLCWLQPAAQISGNSHWPPPPPSNKELLLSLFLKLKPNCFEGL